MKEVNLNYNLLENRGYYYIWEYIQNSGLYSVVSEDYMNTITNYFRDTKYVLRYITEDLK